MVDQDFLETPSLGDRPRTRILLVEDDRQIARGLVALFSDNGWIVEHADTLADARARFGPGSFDLLVVDRTLPDGEGLDFVATLRGAGVVTPVLMLTSMRETVSAIEGLVRGADDYLGKPYDSGELVARVAALARRNERAGMIVRGALEINLLDRLVRYKGVRIAMSGKLFRLLAYMAIHSPLVLTRDMLLVNVWRSKADKDGRAMISSRTADVHLTRLRDVLEAAGVPEIIVTEPGDPIAGQASGWRLVFGPLEG